MPPLSGFSNNPFRTRNDMITATYALLEPLAPYTSSEGARIRLPVSTGTHFDDVAAQLEGYARPLWAVGALLAGSRAPGNPDVDSRLDSWIRGLISGTDPASPEYWGDVTSTDQRMVEMEIIAFALLSAPKAFLPDSMETTVKNNILKYLSSINEKPMPGTNWLWFRVMVNLSLVKTLGVPYETLKPSMDADLTVLDSYYLGDGWSSDGKWDENGRQADYYSGSFAIQFSQMLYVKHAADIDPVRAEVFRQRARDFASDFWRYFSRDGAAIPFGRSLTYRFTFAAFWAAATLAEVELPDPLSPGVVKGMLLRHLRWWAKHDDMFNSDGTLSIGYCYPNMYMSEDYNSPQSVYWCFKTFYAVALPADHPFWTCEELPHPLDFEQDHGKKGSGPSVALVKQARQILCDTGSHHYLLSSGQYCGWPLKATEAKYAKFAYSSTFGFSVPTGPLIQQSAPDSMLSLSLDGGNTWKLRWKSRESISSSVTVHTAGAAETIPVLISTWIPWSDEGIEVETTLVPPTSRWPDWHIRQHKIRLDARLILNNRKFVLTAVEAGFAILGRRKIDGQAVPVCGTNLNPVGGSSTYVEGLLEDGPSSLVFSSAGASGIRQVAVPGSGSAAPKGQILKPDANTNLMTQRTLIPTFRHTVDVDATLIDGTEYYMTEPVEMRLVACVFAVSGGEMSREELRRRWEDVPVVRIGDAAEQGKGDFIQMAT